MQWSARDVPVDGAGIPAFHERVRDHRSDEGLVGVGLFEIPDLVGPSTEV